MREMNCTYFLAVYHFYADIGKKDEYKNRATYKHERPDDIHRAFRVTVFFVSFSGAGCQSLLEADTERLPVQFNECLGNT